MSFQSELNSLRRWGQEIDDSRDRVRKIELLSILTAIIYAKDTVDMIDSLAIAEQIIDVAAARVK